MNATRDVITDLLPLYFSGEASPDTRAMVEEYFKDDPEFERMARRMASSMTVFKVPLADDDALEAQSLMRTRSRVRARNISLGAAIPGFVGCVAILVLGATTRSALAISYPLIGLGVVAVFAVLSLAVLSVVTRKTGL